MSKKILKAIVAVLAALLLIWLVFSLLTKDVRALRKASEALESSDVETAENHLANVYGDAAENSEKVYKPEEEYNKAVLNYNKSDFESAAKTFADTASNTHLLPELRYKSLHNAGNSYFKINDFEKAVEMYDAALKLENSPETAFNREVALKKLEEQQKQQEQEQQNSENQEGEQDNQKNQQGQDKDNKAQKGKNSQKESGEKGQKQQNGEKSEGEEKSQDAGQQDSSKEEQVANEEEKPSEQGKAQDGEKQDSEQSQNENSSSEKEQKGEPQDSEPNQADEISRPESSRQEVEYKKETPSYRMNLTPSNRAIQMKDAKVDKAEMEYYLAEKERQELEKQNYYNAQSLASENPRYLSPEDLQKWMSLRNKITENENSFDW